MEKLTLHSPDLTERNIARMAELFPAVVTEARDEDGNPIRSIDFDLLRQELSPYLVEGPLERYQLDWPGKREALFVANTPIAKTLRPVREDSVDFDTTKHLIIEGDNLDALKLLQESFLGRVKLIYIDPPYNTGNDFLYSDRFATTSAEYLAKSGQVEGGVPLVSNPESSGRFHSAWLSLLYPRLKLARDLLRPDGVIAVSIDDHEVDNLKKMLCELLGKDNFIATLPRVTKKAGKSGDLIAFNHDYVLLFGRSPGVTLNRQFHSDSGFKHEDEFLESRGRYKLNQTLDYSSIQYSRSLDYEIEFEGQILRPGGASREEMEARRSRNPKTDWCWRWSAQLFDYGLANGFVVVKEGRDGPRIYTKTYENATLRQQDGQYQVVHEQRTKAITSLEFTENRYSNDMAAKNIKSLFGFAAFDYTKPVELVSGLVSMVTQPQAGDIILDFFAGSGTTGQAVLEANAIDSGDRRYVLVQLDEEVNASSEAAGRGYRTIAELARERMRLVSARLAAHNPDETDFDLGFRAFRIDSSCMTDVLRVPDAVGQTELAAFVPTVKPDRSDEDLLFQVILTWGLSPSLPVERKALGRQGAWVVDQGALVACFQGPVDAEVVTGIAELGPLRVVFLDSCFATDSERINVEQQLRRHAKILDIKTV